MNKITINKGNIEKYGFNLSYRQAIVLGAISYIFQKKANNPFEQVNENGVLWFGCSVNSIIKEVPILKLQKNTCVKIVNDLILMGFIERHFNCARLSKTYLKPSENIRSYFENDINVLFLDQGFCIDFDNILNPTHWILLNCLEKTTEKAIYKTFVSLDENKILKSIGLIIGGKTRYKTTLSHLVTYGYLEKSEIVNKTYFKAGAKFLECKKNEKKGF